MVFETNCVIKDFNFPIEALAFFDKWLFLAYRCNGNTDLYIQENEESNVRIKNFRRKSLIKLTIVNRRLSLILSLNTEGILTVHFFEFPTVLEVFTFNALKQISLFSLDTFYETNDHSFRISVYSKKRFYFLIWNDNKTFSCFLSKSENNFVGINFSDYIYSTVWSNNLVYIACKKEYFLLDIENRQSKELCQVQDRNVEPLLIRIDEKVVGAQVDFRTLVFDRGAPSCNRSTVEWSSVPLNVCYMDPFILGLLSNTVEVRFFISDSLIQTIDIKSFHVRPISQLSLESYSSTGFLYSTSSVWQLNREEVKLSLEKFIENNEFQTAVCLVNCVCNGDEEKTKLIKRIRTTEAKYFFKNEQFHKAMEIFCEIDADPLVVIQLFHDIMPERYRIYSEINQENNKTSSSPEAAVRELIMFLTEKRRRLLSLRKKGFDSIFCKSECCFELSNEEMLELIDTSLLKCYLRVNDALVSPLLRLDNRCILEESERLLKEHRKLSQVITLYEQRKLHVQALQLLKDEAIKEDSPLFGYEQITKYLKTLGNEFLNILFEYAPLVLQTCGENDFLGLFTADLSTVEGLDRLKVFEFIQEFSPHLVFKYLIHVVQTWKDPSPAFHNRLILAYLDSLKNNHPTEENDLREKLKEFLETSKFYNSEYVLPFFDDDFLEEKAILLRNLNLESEALKLYCEELKNFDSCLAYCSKSENPIALYEKFLALLLEKNTAEYVNAAIKLLDLHGLEMDYVKVLKMLPDTMKICDVQKFLMNALRKSAELKRKNQLMKNMRNAELVKLKEEKILYEQTKFYVTEDRICKVCKKRLSNSALVRYPGGVIIHFGCCKDFSNIPKN